MKKTLQISSLLLALCAVLAFGSARLLAAESSFSFKVHNTTKDKITKILVSEDGKDYGEFDVGDGIEAGQTVKLVWDKTTDTEDCKQWVKAVFEDGSESKAAQFDFCEDDLEMDF